MNRRTFIKTAGGGALALCGLGALEGCRSLVRSDLDKMDMSQRDPRPSGIPSRARRILYLSSLAPSGHNTQPWNVHISDERHFTLGGDVRGHLEQADPYDREMALSIGAFMECLSAGALSEGFTAEFTVASNCRCAPEMVSVELKETPKKTSWADRILNRRTLRRQFRSEPIRDRDFEALNSVLGAGVRFFPRGSKEALFLADAATESFRTQIGRDEAMAELTDWIRFSRKEASDHRDGFTAESLEITGISSWTMSTFTRKTDAVRKTFNERGLEMIRTQSEQGAGWLVMTTPDEDVPSLLGAGRRFCAATLIARERGIGIHPMSQMLEEEPWRTTVGKELGVSGIPQFVLRVGRVDGYPSPVSLRRPPEWFAKKVL